MNKLFVLTSLLLLAGTMVVAQDTLGSGAKPEAQDPPSKSQSSSAQNSVIRGCLSGSTGNFTLTDQNGMQYKLMGNDGALQSKVGHEIEISGAESQSAASNGDDQESVAHSPNAFQVAEVRDISGSCQIERDRDAPRLNK
jgi:hypothetical protein